jgi:4-diphosphocytidyl-2-C-methyl-D-erythritol kinase
VIWSTRCPAKLNLFLSVGPRDERGWHPLRTIFQAIDLIDRLSVRFIDADRDELTSNVDYLPLENTVTRSIREFRRLRSLPPISVHLDKKIPAQSGLGGGSSDGAGILRILQEVVEEPVPESDLIHIAGVVGADVPFFLVGGKVKAEGYGEILSPVEDSPERHYLVVKPEVDCATPTMFRALDKIAFPWKDFTLSDDPYNDFERVMPELCSLHLDRLRTFGAKTVGLSGSGSAVYGWFENHTEAMTALNLFKDLGEENAWVCKSLTRAECLDVTCEPL